jgi:hypothetical protein
MQRRWDYYWGTESRDERPQRRDRRGEDEPKKLEHALR